MESACQVTAIIPVFNQEERITACLESVLSQEGVDLEVICVNDGSTDGTREVVEAYCARDERVVLVDQDNAGAATARNVGIARAKGEFIAFCDADDLVPFPRIYSRLYHAAKKSGVYIAGGSFSLCAGGSDCIQSSFDGLLSGYTFFKEGLVEYRDYQFDYGFTRFLFSRDFLLEHELVFPDEERFEDPVFLSRALYLAGSFFAIPDIVYLCNIEHEQQDHEWSASRTLSLLRGIKANLLFSSQRDLPELHALTLRRLEEEYCGIIKTPVSDMRILEKLVDVNGAVDWELLECARCGRDGALENSRIIKPLAVVFDDFVWRSEITETAAFQIARYATGLQRRLARLVGKRRR